MPYYFIYEHDISTLFPIHAPRTPCQFSKYPPHLIYEDFNIIFHSMHARAPFPIFKISKYQISGCFCLVLCCCLIREMCLEVMHDQTSRAQMMVYAKYHATIFYETYYMCIMYVCTTAMVVLCKAKRHISTAVNYQVLSSVCPSSTGSVIFCARRKCIIDELLSKCYILLYSSTLNTNTKYLLGWILLMWWGSAQLTAVTDIRVCQNYRIVSYPQQQVCLVRLLNRSEKKKTYIYIAPCCVEFLLCETPVGVSTYDVPT